MSHPAQPLKLLLEAARKHLLCKTNPRTPAFPRKTIGFVVSWATATWQAVAPFKRGPVSLVECHIFHPKNR